MTTKLTKEQFISRIKTLQKGTGTKYPIFIVNYDNSNHEISYDRYLVYKMSVIGAISFSKNTPKVTHRIYTNKCLVIISVPGDSTKEWFCEFPSVVDVRECLYHLFK